MKKHIPDTYEEIIPLIISDYNLAGKALLSINRDYKKRKISMMPVYQTLYNFNIIGESLSILFHDHCASDSRYLYDIVKGLDLKVLKRKEIKVLIDPKTKIIGDIWFKELDKKIRAKENK